LRNFLCASNLKQVALRAKHRFLWTLNTSLPIFFKPRKALPVFSSHARTSESERKASRKARRTFGSLQVNYYRPQHMHFIATK